MSAAQANPSNDAGSDDVGYFVSLKPTREERSNGLVPYLTSYGNRVVLTAREAELRTGDNDGNNEGSLDEHNAINEKFRLGFRSNINDRMDAFQYHPLPTSSSIRLVRILPTSDDGIVRLSMDTYDLNESMPPYHCLSYTWGNPHSRLPMADFYAAQEDKYNQSALWPVQCNDELLWVRRNLFDALRQVPQTHLYVGIDRETSDFLTATNSDGKNVIEAQMTELQNIMAEPESFGLKQDQTAFMVAAKMGFTELCWLSIKSGADPYEKDVDGHTAFDLAIQNGHTACADTIATETDKTAPEGSLIWIDAICINQQDLAERSAQVQMMGKLYSEAERVVVWLGIADPLSQFGLQALGKLSRSITSGALLRSKVIPFAPYDQTKAFEDAGIPNLDNHEWAGLASIFLRQYFRRVWSLQEAVLAQETVAFLGDAEIPWEILLFLAHEFRRMETYNGKSFSTRFQPNYAIHVEHEAEDIWKHRMRRQLDETTQERRDKWFEESNNTFKRGTGKRCQQPLLELVLSTATLNCYDARDRIYGLLGIAGHHPESPQIVPDYSKPLSHLWAQVTRHHIETNDEARFDNLDILGHMRDTIRTDRDDLPSWVPDYGYIGRAPLGTTDFQAAGDKRHIPKSNDMWNQLTVRGVKVDTIDALARPRDPSFKVTKYDIDPTWFELVLKMDSIYRTGQSRTEVLWRTLCADQLAVSTQHFGRGESPAPVRYGKQFSDLVCAMILAARDAKAADEGRPEGINPLTIELMTAMSTLTLQDTGNTDPSFTPEMIVDSMLALSTAADSTAGQAMNLLCDLADDESRSTPTVQDITAYMRNPTYRFNHATNGVNTQADGLSFQALDREHSGFVERFSAIYGYRRLFLTSSRYLGLGPASVETGDEVWALAGAKAPFVLRPMRDSNRITYRLIGETYVHGFMRGEAVEVAGGEFSEIVLE